MGLERVFQAEVLFTQRAAERQQLLLEAGLSRQTRFLVTPFGWVLSPWYGSDTHTKKKLV